MNDLHRFRTVLIEGETLLRSSLARLIHGSDRFELLADFEQVSPARETCGGLQPDLVIIDVDFAPEESLEFIELIGRQKPGVKVLALSGGKNPEVSFRLMKANIQGFVAKDEPIDVLEEAMDELSGGRRYLPAAFVRDCDAYSSSLGVSVDPVTHRLTLTEIRILRRVAAGRTSRQIADELHLSPRSIETYRSRVMRKLGVANAAALVEYAVRNGIASAR